MTVPGSGAGGPPPAPEGFPFPAEWCGLALPGRPEVRLWRAADPYALLDDPRYTAEFAARGELMPYWSDQWPASLVLADVVADWIRDGPGPPRGRALELGAGLGGPGLLLARVAPGWEVVLTDVAADAQTILRLHAAANGVAERCPVREVDFLDPDGLAEDLRGTCDLVLAADILFERRNPWPVARTIARLLAPDGVALLADPGRITAEAFPGAARAAGLAATRGERAVPGPWDDGERPVIGVWQLRLADDGADGGPDAAAGG